MQSDRKLSITGFSILESRKPHSLRMNDGISSNNSHTIVRPTLESKKCDCPDVASSSTSSFTVKSSSSKKISVLPAHDRASKGKRFAFHQCTVFNLWVINFGAGKNENIFELTNIQRCNQHLELMICICGRPESVFCCTDNNVEKPKSSVCCTNNEDKSESATHYIDKSEENTDSIACYIDNSEDMVRQMFALLDKQELEEILPGNLRASTSLNIFTSLNEADLIPLCVKELNAMSKEMVHSILRGDYEQLTGLEGKIDEPYNIKPECGTLEKQVAVANLTTGSKSALAKFSTNINQIKWVSEHKHQVQLFLCILKEGNRVFLWQMLRFCLLYYIINKNDSRLNAGCDASKNMYSAMLDQEIEIDKQLSLDLEMKESLQPQTKMQSIESVSFLENEVDNFT
ncbi:unnamed protein product [Thelazia callipaeda]|uniref:Keratinocyte differentiation factor 1 n=1 Tax=Thelazia callipaeda TaxID=103827 RepID=A0A0N5D2G2_THECL|nr:unnamed protein product [Thelazia callipaeda]